jgi:hypothetical protein
MNRLTRSLSFALILSVPMAVGACSSDDDATSTTDVVVAGAPLTITNPALVGGADANVVVGTLQNVTDRTIEITSASSSAGEIEFRSADGSLLASLKIDPNAELTLEADGVHLELVAATSADTVDVVLGLDIEDNFNFTAERQGE